jgi:hypothetical protein
MWLQKGNHPDTDDQKKQFAPSVDRKVFHDGWHADNFLGF